MAYRETLQVYVYLNLLVHKQLLRDLPVPLLQAGMVQPDSKHQSVLQVLIVDSLKESLQLEQNGDTERALIGNK